VNTLARYAALLAATVWSGLDNRDVLSDELFQAAKRSANHGRSQLIVRSKRQPGTITIEASVEGLPPATLVLHSEVAR